MTRAGAKVEQIPKAWVQAAHDVLLETAQRYQQVITTKELADEVQVRSDIAATQRSHVWIGGLLDLVSAECAARDEPNLSALCVNAKGSVGNAYGATVQAVTGEQPDDPDAHAAEARLACYAHVGAAGMPAGGGIAALTPQLSASRSRLRKAALAARPVDSCPECHMVLPANSSCDTCD